MKKILCIYHGKCADGFTAAWAVRKYFLDKPDHEVVFHPGFYNEQPPVVEPTTDIVMVDFSYKSDVLLALGKKCRSILVLDHHQTAQKDMEAFFKVSTYNSKNPLDNWDLHQGNIYQDRCEGIYPSIYTNFDMERSGATITWDFFFPRTARPQLFNHVEDRDLWKFKLDKTREIQASMFSYHYNFENWDMLMNADLNTLAVEGTAIERKHFKDVEELCGERNIRYFTIGGYEKIPMMNIPYTMGSDAGALLAKSAPFAGYYLDLCGDRMFGLRSNAPDGVDVSQIAALYGGGGHKHSSGFRLPFDRSQCNENQLNLLQQMNDDIGEQNGN